MQMNQSLVDEVVRKLDDATDAAGLIERPKELMDTIVDQLWTNAPGFSLIVACAATSL